MSVIDEIAHTKEVRVTKADIRVTVKWLNQLKKETNCLKNSKNSNFKLIKNDLISNKKKYFFKEKLNDNICQPKELWESLNYLGVPSKNKFRFRYNSYSSRRHSNQATFKTNLFGMYPRRRLVRPVNGH